MEYSERAYRRRFRSDRWHGFEIKVKDSDLWIGVDRASYLPEMEGFCLSFLEGLRERMEAYLAIDRGYAESLLPYNPRPDAPEIMVRMANAAKMAGVGPMAAVAGAVACEVGRALCAEFAVRETLVENGGDIWALTETGLDVSVFAGASPLSERVGLSIPAGEFGICTSSGTVGPSLSLGYADAVMIVCKDALLADAYATEYANRVQDESDVKLVAECAGGAKEVLGALVVKNSFISVKAKECELKVFTEIMDNDKKCSPSVHAEQCHSEAQLRRGSEESLEAPCKARHSEPAKQAWSLFRSPRATRKREIPRRPKGFSE